MKTPREYASEVLKKEAVCGPGELWLALHAILTAAFTTALSNTPLVYTTALEAWARGYAQRNP